MRYRVFYADEPGSVSKIEAQSHLFAAKEFFSHNQTKGERLITVETDSFFNYEIKQFLTPELSSTYFPQRQSTETPQGEIPTRSNESLTKKPKPKEGLTRVLGAFTKTLTRTIDVFISHSSKDTDVAEALIDLLRVACTIPADRIRCTSVDGYRLAAGASTDIQLKREVHDARVFIGLITPASIQSAYVLFELGARWGAGLHLAPILARSADGSYLRGPLSGLNALSCSSAPQVHQFVSEVAEILGYPLASAATYYKYLEKLISVSSQSSVRESDLA